VQELRLASWFEADALVEERAQAFVSFGDRFPEPERAFRLECEPPQSFVETIELEAAFGCIEGSPRLARIEAAAADAREQVDVGRAQPSQLAFRPCVVRAGERLAGEERERAFEQLLSLWGKETRFGLCNRRSAPSGSDTKDRGTSRGIRCVVGVEVAHDRQWWLDVAPGDGRAGLLRVRREHAIGAMAVAATALVSEEE
jgi:hypothetical protein